MIAVEVATSIPIVQVTNKSIKLLGLIGRPDQTFNTATVVFYCCAGTFGLTPDLLLLILLINLASNLFPTGIFVVVFRARKEVSKIVGLSIFFKI